MSAPTVLGSIQKVIASTPNTNFDSESYRRDVLEPARKIRKLATDLGEGAPSESQIRESVELLVGILAKKGVPRGEQEEQMRELLDKHQLHAMFPDLLKRIAST